MHVEPAPRRREAMAESGRGADGDGKVRPGHSDGVERVEIVETDCWRLGMKVRGDTGSVDSRYWRHKWPDQPGMPNQTSLVSAESKVRGLSVRLPTGKGVARI